MRFPFLFHHFTTLFFRTTRNLFFSISWPAMSCRLFACACVLRFCVGVTGKLTMQSFSLRFILIRSVLCPVHIRLTERRWNPPCKQDISLSFLFRISLIFLLPLCNAKNVLLQWSMKSQACRYNVCSWFCWLYSNMLWLSFILVNLSFDGEAFVSTSLFIRTKNNIYHTDLVHCLRRRSVLDKQSDVTNASRSRLRMSTYRRSAGSIRREQADSKSNKTIGS